MSHLHSVKKKMTFILGEAHVTSENIENTAAKQLIKN